MASVGAVPAAVLEHDGSEKEEDTMDMKQRIESWGKGMWAPFVRQARDSARRSAAGRPSDEQLQQLIDAREIELVLRRYHNFYDAGDVDGIVSCFTDDAVSISALGTFIGRASIESCFAHLTAHQQMIIHYATGVVVTVDDDDPDAGLITARHLNIVFPTAGPPSASGGTYVNRMRRVDGLWLIAEQRITPNFKFEFEPSVPHYAFLEHSDLPLSSLDLLEARYKPGVE